MLIKNCQIKNSQKTTFICSTRLKTEKHLATAKQLIRKNSICCWKNQATFFIEQIHLGAASPSIICCRCSVVHQCLSFATKLMSKYDVIHFRVKKSFEFLIVPSFKKFVKLQQLYHSACRCLQLCYSKQEHFLLHKFQRKTSPMSLTFI